ncbi:MAG: radical SAM protein [Myxococcota bacterium]
MERSAVRIEAPNELVRGQGQGVRYAVWEITLACDLGCRHCGSRAGKARPRELSTEECLKVVADLAVMEVQEVTLIGGEAYLREDWDQIAKAIGDAGMYCGITTGGRGFDDIRLKRAIDAGVRVISVSLDGLRETHNAQRGTRDAFDNALATARRVAASPIQLAVNTQINRLSMVELVGLSELLIELGVKAWQLQLTVPMGRAADRADLLLQPYDLLDLFPLLDWIKREKLTPNGIDMFPGNNIGYFGEYEERLRYGGAAGTHWSGCKAGDGCIGIESDGAVKACPSLPTKQYTGGSALEGDVGDIVRDSPEINAIPKRSRDDLWGFCKTCYYGDVCKAGCNWTAHVLMGRPGNNPYCIHRALEHEAQGLREVLVRTQAAPGEPFDHGAFKTVTEPLEPKTDAAILGVPVESILQLRPSDRSLRSDQKKRLRLI